MRAVITGQVGLDKKRFLQRVADIAREQGFDSTICNIGDMMYQEAPDVGKGRILDLPLSRLNGLRRSVFKDVLRLAERRSHLLVNTHATFRWRHGLFYAFDPDQMQQLSADVYICIVDNIDRVHWRLTRDGHVDHSLKDLMVWREEEVLATELLSQIVKGHGCFYIMSPGMHPDFTDTADALFRLLFRPEIRKAYLSFPMTHVMDSPDILSEIEAFRREMKRCFTCFDPGDVEEKYLEPMAIAAAQAGHRTVTVGPPGEETQMETAELLAIIPDIDGQIYVRDFKLIDQSDMIISLIPELPTGKPGLSSGVERELQHAHEAAKDVFVIWRCAAAPSPFITETATRVFRTPAEASQYFHDKGYVPSTPTGGLFSE